jgi:acyl-ACP thioesterase
MDGATRSGILDPGLTGQDARPVDGVDNGYLAGYRVRFDEAGPDGNLRTSALLRYAQDVAWRHSEQLGFDRDWYRRRGLGWVVRGVELELDAAIPLGTTLRVSTAVVGHRRIWARRLGECRFADGRIAARITTDWVLLDGRGRIVRIPDDFGVAFANPEVKSEILRVPAETGDPAARHRLTVRPTDLDPVDHVNNAIYVDWLEEAIEAAGWSGGTGPGDAEGPDAAAAGDRTAAGSAPGTLRIEYLQSAGRGDAVDIHLYGSPHAWRARIGRSDGQELVRAARDLSRSSSG